ncbi:MAG: peptidylprolyl isomerase [Pseudomonadota bacterium]
MPYHRFPWSRAAFLGALVFGLSACTEQQSTLTSARQVDAATAALVNGSPIYISDVELEAIAQGKVNEGDPFGPENPEFKTILDQLVDQRLLAQEAERRGLDEDTAARRRLEAGRERLLGNILVENLVATAVTDAAIDEMYDEQVKLQQLDDEVRLRHILVETEAEAGRIYRELEGGRDFTEAAFEYSDDIRTRLDGGDFGWVSPNALMDPFPAQVGNTETGRISDPFQSEQGWHIIKIDERRTRPPKTKDEMRPEIVTFLTFTEISDLLRELRATADIREREDQDQRSPSRPTEAAETPTADETQETPAQQGTGDGDTGE